MGSPRSFVRTVERSVTEPFKDPKKFFSDPASLLSTLDPVSSTLLREGERKKQASKQKLKGEALAAALAEEARLKEVAEAVPTLQDEEVESAGRKVRRRVQQAAGRRSTILSNRRLALGGTALSLGDRPISRPSLGGF